MSYEKKYIYTFEDVILRIRNLSNNDMDYFLKKLNVISLQYLEKSIRLMKEEDYSFYKQVDIMDMNTALDFCLKHIDTNAQEKCTCPNCGCQSCLNLTYITVEEINYLEGKYPVCDE